MRAVGACSLNRALGNNALTVLLSVSCTKQQKDWKDAGCV